jgi:hypothetical protein
MENSYRATPNSMSDFDDILFADDGPTKPDAMTSGPLELTPEMEAVLNELTPQQLRILEGYVNHGNLTRAARDAGCDSAPKGKAMEAALKQVHKSLAMKFRYNAAAAFEDINDAADFAKDNRAAMALVKAIELKMKLAGHLVERKENNVNVGLNLGGFQIVIHGIDDPDYEKARAADSRIIEHTPDDDN